MESATGSKQKQSPHFILSLADNLPSALVERFKSELSADGFRFNIQKFPFGGPYMSMEWAIPTAIGAFILKPYFESFLKEAGKDHYELLKKWLKKNGEATKEIKFHTIAATNSTEKLKPGNNQSKGFSIESITNNEGRIKFLFDNTLPEEVWNINIDSALLLLENHFADGENDKLSKVIKGKAMPRTIFCIIDTNTHEWIFLDTVDLYHQHLATRQQE